MESIILLIYSCVWAHVLFACLEQVQNFPQKTIFAGSNFSWQDIKRKAVYTRGAGPVCKCTGQCTLEGSVQGGG